MKQKTDSLQKLFQAARQAELADAEDHASLVIPNGLAESLSARWSGRPHTEKESGVWWEPSWAAMATAALVMLLSLGIHLRRQENAWQPDTLVQQSLEQTFFHP